MNYTKEHEISIANRLKEKYKCDIIFNEDIPYTLYCAQHISNIINYKNIRQYLSNNKDNVIKIKKKQIMDIIINHISH